MSEALRDRLGACGERRKWWTLGNACISITVALLIAAGAVVAFATIRKRDLRSSRS